MLPGVTDGAGVTTRSTASQPGVPAVRLTALTKEFVERRAAGRVLAVNEVDLDIAEGEFFALLGPSGCGKTTTLRMIAGFEQPDGGEVLLRGRAMKGVPAFHRPVNTVFQDFALFPHMTVMQNVMFGLRMANVPAKEARRKAEEALQLVRLPHVAERKPSALSGGQKQRVAVARALVNNARDELRPGMSFRVTLDLPGIPYPVIPETGLQWGAQGAYIWSVVERRAHRVSVAVVQRQEGQVLVEAPDLDEGDLIVVEGIQRVREGMEVTYDPPSLADRGADGGGRAAVGTD